MIVKFNYNEKFNELYLSTINETNKYKKDQYLVALIDLFMVGPSEEIKQWFNIEDYMNYEQCDIEQTIACKCIEIVNKNIVNLECYRNAYSYFVTAVKNTLVDFSKKTMPLKMRKKPLNEMDKISIYSYEECVESSEHIIKFPKLPADNILEETVEKNDMKNVIPIVKSIEDGDLFIKNIVQRISVKELAKQEHTTPSKIRTRLNKVVFKIKNNHSELKEYFVA